MRALLWVAASFVTASTAIPVVARTVRPPVPAATLQVADDTLALSRLLNVVRGADPLVCELAVRSVDGGSWGRGWGSASGGALEMDAASAAVIRWIHDDHDDSRLLPRLSAGLRGTDRCVRRLSASLLGRMEHPGARTALRAALDDAVADTRAFAALGLGLAEDKAAVPFLVRKLKDNAPEVRRSAAWALGSIEDKAAMLPLIEVLERDPDARVRQAAAWAIGQVTG